MDNARVLIVVRHPVISDALQSILEVDGFRVAGRVSSAHEAVARAGSLQPEIILLDSELLLATGEGLIDRLLAAGPQARIVVLASPRYATRFPSGADNRVAGTLPRDISAVHLLSHIRGILADGNKKPVADNTSAKPALVLEKPLAPPPPMEATVAEVTQTARLARPSMTWLPGFLSAGLLTIAIFALNTYLVWPLFLGGYTRHTDSIESAFITDARFIVENGLFATWSPLWYLGFPFHLFYTPLLPYLTALLHLASPDISVPSAYRVVSALFYAVGPATLFLFVRYLTGRTLTGVIAAVAYSILPSVIYLMPGPRGDATSFGLAPWQLVVMIKYGEGPHIASLAFTPLAALFFLRALRRFSLINCALAAVMITIVALINWIGLFALVVILAALTLSEALVSRPFHKLLFAAGCGALAYGLSAFWYNLSFIRASLSFGGGAGLISNLPTIIIVGVILIYILAIRFSGQPKIQVEMIIGLWLLLFGAIVLGGEYLGINLAPQPIRYTPELSIGVILVCAHLLARTYDALAGRLGQSIARLATPLFAAGVIVALAFQAQPFLLGEGWGEMEPHKDFTSTSEHRVARWLAANGEGEPAYATGSHGFWLNIEGDVTQLRGGTDQGATNPWWAHVTYQINSSPDAETSILWLRALGIRWLVANYPESTDAYKDFAFPRKFDNLLPRRYLEQGTAIFEVPLPNPGPVQLVDAARLRSLAPIFNAIDVKNLTRYIAAVESTGTGGQISYRRTAINRFEIEADVAEGQALLVKTTYDASWKAYVDGKLATVWQDVAGFIVVEIAEPGRHEIRVEHERAYDVIAGYFISALTLMFLMAYSIQHFVRAPFTNARITWERLVPAPILHFFALAASLASFAPIAQLYLNAYPPPGTDFFHGVSAVSYLKTHLGLWFSMWNYSWFAGDPFLRQYGALSSYMALPFASLLGDGPGLLVFLATTQFLFVLFTYLFLHELSKRYVVAASLAIIVPWSANLLRAPFGGGFTAAATGQMFLPLCLYMVARYLRTGDARLLVAGAGLNGLAFLTHPVQGALIAGLSAVILFCSRRHIGKLSLTGNLVRALGYGFIALVIASPIAIPLLTTLQYTRRIVGEVSAASAAGKAASIGEPPEPDAPFLIFQSSNQALLIVLVVLLGWWILQLRLRHSRAQVSPILIGFAVASVLVVAGQVVFALGMNPAPTTLAASRTWWLAPLLFAAVAALLAREIIPENPIANDGKARSLWKRALTPLALGMLFLTAAVLGPSLAKSDVDRSLVRATFAPPAATDLLMGRQERKDTPLVPSWMDIGSTNVRAWVLNHEVSVWWNALYQLPITAGYFDPAYTPWHDWRQWMQMAINGSLAKEPGITPTAANNVARFLIDWFAIRYFITVPGSAYDSPVAPYLLGDDFVERSALLNGMQTAALRSELSDPIASGTNTPTLLVIGDSVAYETIVRDLALVNYGSRQVIPIRGPQRIDDMSAEELSRFSAVVLYNYSYSEAPRSFAMLEDYVRRGGGLFIETGSLVPESETDTLPSLFPIRGTRREPLGAQWLLVTDPIEHIETSSFSPPVYESAPWKFSHATGEAFVRPWAKVMLEQDRRPIMVRGTLDKGRVVWSGMNLPYHIISNNNLSEASLLTNIIAWISPQRVVSSPIYSVQRPSPESLSVVGSGFKGVLFKETGFDGWEAKVVTDNRSTGVRIYRAGVDFMYVFVPVDGDQQVETRFTYSGPFGDRVLATISFLTILFSIDYVFLRWRIARGILLVQQTLQRWLGGRRIRPSKPAGRGTTMAKGAGR